MVLLVGAAYLVGLLPERSRRIALEGQVGSLERRLGDAEARMRLCALYARVQGLVDLVALKNFGQAQQRSSSFFDDVRSESNRTPDPEFRKALLGVLEMRDTVTASLTKGDPATLDSLRRSAELLQAPLQSPGTASGAPTPTALPTSLPTPAPGPKL
jgi:hypothetical protein